MRWLTEAMAATHMPPAAEVAGYFQAAGHPELIDDELACNAAVLGVVLTKAGIRVPRTLAGKTYLSFGTPIEAPRAGAIVLLPVPEDGNALRAGIVHSVPEWEDIVVLVGTKGGGMRREDVSRLAIVACRWPMPGAREPVASTPEAPPLVLVRAPLEPAQEPTAAEVPATPPPMPLPPIPGSEGLRRREAKAAVRKAVADVNRVTADDHFRYELALLVVNDNVEAMSDMRDAAAIEGVTVKEYAKRVIATHNARRRRAAQIYAIEAQALKDIDAATGPVIETIAAEAARNIRGDDEA